jgi:hypothetical protein
MHANIDHLNLRIASASGHEHRIRPITRRALELLRLRLRDELLAADARMDDQWLANLSLPALRVDLASLSDEAVADQLADAMYSALRARWQEG